jgi:hypothetical protein
MEVSMSDRRDDPADELLPEVVDSAAGRSPTRRQQGLVRRIRRDEEELLAFFDFPAEHWVQTERRSAA